MLKLDLLKTNRRYFKDKAGFQYSVFHYSLLKGFTAFDNKNLRYCGSAFETTHLYLKKITFLNV